MVNLFKKLKLVLLFIFLVGQIKLMAKKGTIGYGAEIAYNIPIESAALGLRMHVKVDDNWFLSPQFAIFPGLMNTQELYAGMNLNYSLFPKAKWTIYPMVGAFYNRWFNHENYINNLAELDNFAPEFGLGILKNKGCWRPFLEYRANPLWWESNIRLGVVFYFGECFVKYLCPAYSK